ncbi:MAG: CinA family nicotinamide mononucleotide deamidase-related protein [Planctomycetales bacterium]
MPAEIIAVGSEITSGAKLDTNSQWLSVELDAAGIAVGWHTTIADDLAAMLDAFRIACERADLVIITGGLGPTLDDLTRQALAGLTGTTLVLHEPSLAAIREMFARRKRKMAERNVLQAMFPDASEPLPNPLGTAPGIWVEVPRRGGSRRVPVAALPGVPAEMKRMFVREVLPRLAGGGRVIRRARIHCFGAGESDVEELLGDLTARGRDPEIGITAHEATITLRIFAAADSVDECDAKIASAKQAIRERLGRLVFGEGDEELEHVVVRLLSERGLTLATAESGSGGLLAQRLTEAPGFERCYVGGVIAPTAAAQLEFRLQPDGSREEAASVIRQPEGRAPAPLPAGAEAARAMAEGCRRRFRTDFALAVGGVVTSCELRVTSEEGLTPPGGNSSLVTRHSSLPDVPFVHVALAGEGLLETRSHALLQDPTINRSRAAKMALDLLRLHLTTETTSSARA